METKEREKNEEKGGEGKGGKNARVQVRPTDAHSENTMLSFQIFKVELCVKTQKYFDLFQSP